MWSPFPGMDPYLERYWGDIGSSLAVTAKVALNRQLGDGLVARNDRRLIPDPASPSSDPMRQPFVQILDADGNRVVTVIEFLSPSNKLYRAARESYRAKQEECLEGRSSLVEVDLTRAGRRRLLMDMLSLPAERRGEYMVSVWRAYTGKFGRREGYGLRLRQRLPGIRVPLRDGDPDIVLDLQSLVDQAYEAGAYGRSLDYGRPLDEPLSADDAAWAEGLVRAAGR